MDDKGTFTVSGKLEYLPTNNEYKINSGNYLKLYFKDTGKGIDPKIIKKVFSPYYSTKKNGLGLGLSLCEKIIFQHSGVIRVNSEIGKGSEFWFLLPAIKQIKIEKEKITEKIKPFNYNILVLDDDEQILKTLEKMLNKLDCSCETTKKGEDTIQAFQNGILNKKSFDLGIFDLTIPEGLGGVETLKQILKIDPNFRSIVSSGFSHKDPLNQFEEFGFKSVLKKPYTIQELFKAIQNCMKN